jgi:hypothetical protein
MFVLPGIVMEGLFYLMADLLLLRHARACLFYFYLTPNLSPYPLWGRFPGREEQHSKNRVGRNGQCS